MSGADRCRNVRGRAGATGGDDGAFTIPRCTAPANDLLSLATLSKGPRFFVFNGFLLFGFEFLNPMYILLREIKIEFFLVWDIIIET